MHICLCIPLTLVPLQSCLPFCKIMCTKNTICLYNLNFVCTVFLCRDNYTILLKCYIIFLSYTTSKYENLPEIIIKQCVYSKIKFGHPVIYGKSWHSCKNLKFYFMCTNASIQCTNFTLTFLCTKYTKCVQVGSSAIVVQVVRLLAIANQSWVLFHLYPYDTFEIHFKQ